MGPIVPPQAMPPFPLLMHDGQRSDTIEVMRGRVTAMQLMFTGCSGVCPIQGALFAAVAQGIAAHPHMQLLSLTIDPLSDDAPALRRWLAQFGAPPRWLAAAPRVADVDALRLRLGGPGGDAVDAHTRQVHVFDRHARLAYRTAELPAARVVLEAMTVIGRAS